MTCVALSALAVSIPGSSAATPASPPSSPSGVPPRIAGAMGIIPAHGLVDIAAGKPIDLVYHGGRVMDTSPPGVTIHTVFWAPSGYAFGGSPGNGVLAYEPLVQQFFSDVAHDSGSQTNIFSLLGQYMDRTGTGGYQLSYNAAANSIDDTHPYPAAKDSCVSPAGIATCVTDTQVGKELNRVISANDPTGRGLRDVWFVFLPPGVDECYLKTSCGTNAFAGYHSVDNLGHGPVIYAVIIDPQIEFNPPPGSDPQGNPVAETAIDTSAHELIESLTDPDGVGWMDPNGMEIGDKCENGPQIATPLGYAPDGAPYNQLINGHEYLTQAVWSNAAHGCIDRTSSPVARPAPQSVSMTQFSPMISGNIGEAKGGIKVAVLLGRAQQPVAGVQTVTRSNGSWGPVPLRSASPGTPHAFGDDRDAIFIAYSKGGPKPDAIVTGSGGNPFTASGWTGWYDLDTGVTVGRHSVQISPCTQVGVLDVRVGPLSAPPPIDHCGAETAIAKVSTPPIGPGTRVTLSSFDNRAFSASNEAGALVDLTVPVGEPGSVGIGLNNQVALANSGFPTCDTDLRSQVVVCSGLVPGRRYTLVRRRGGATVAAHAVADRFGIVSVRTLPGPIRVRGGDLVAMRNAAGRLLTTLHVAHLQVAIAGNQTVVASGTCEAGDYWGRPVELPPVGKAVDVGGVSGTGTICPVTGSATGLPDGLIQQTDDLSGGLTRTAVPLLIGSDPTNDATVYGPFTALAQTGLRTATNGTYAGGARVSLTIRRAGSTHVVFKTRNVDTSRGVHVAGLATGVYTATWVVTDINGDTRTVQTRFVEAG